MQQKNIDEQRLRQLEAICELSAIRFEVALQRLREAIRYEQRYNPNWASEPRVPSGGPAGGQWVGGTSSSARIHIDVADGVSGFTKHALNRAIERLIAPADILDAIQHPLRIRARPDGTTQYIGGRATVVVDEEGDVVTMWRLY
jgi:hypothetical protein